MPRLILTGNYLPASAQFAVYATQHILSAAEVLSDNSANLHTFLTNVPHTYMHP